MLDGHLLDVDRHFEPRFQNLATEHGMFVDNGALGVRQLVGLVQDGQRDAHLADVMQQTAGNHFLAIRLAPAEMLRKSPGETGHHQGMTIGSTVVRLHGFQPG